MCAQTVTSFFPVQVFASAMLSSAILGQAMTTADYCGAGLSAVGLFVFLYGRSHEKGAAKARELDASASDSTALLQSYVESR